MYTINFAVLGVFERRYGVVLKSNPRYQLSRLILMAFTTHTVQPERSPYHNGVWPENVGF